MAEPRVIGIVQARFRSTRLPGKVLLPLAGEPMIARVVRRTKRSATLERTVVATTVSGEDDRIVDLCRSRDWPCERGSEEDVLDRYYRTALAHRADVVVRITSDCPVIDPGIVDRVVREFQAANCDYASNTLEPRTYPRGLDVEVVSFKALRTAWQEDRSPTWREHVTPFVYRHPEAFRLHRVPHDEDLSHHRWTVDTREDYELVRRIYDYFRNDDFVWTEVLALLKERPDWAAINRNVKQKVVL